MPTKVEAGGISKIKIRSIGGEICAVSSLAPKIGPLGLSPKKIGEQLCEATKEWGGLRIMCELTIKNRVAEVQVAPSVSVMLIKFLKEPKRDRKKTKNIKHEGNLQIGDIVSIAKIMRTRSFSITLLGGVKEVIGTAISMGCKIDNKKAKKFVYMPA